jgi:hypothetical protein
LHGQLRDPLISLEGEPRLLSLKGRKRPYDMALIARLIATSLLGAFVLAFLKIGYKIRRRDRQPRQRGFKILKARPDDSVEIEYDPRSQDWRLGIADAGVPASSQSMGLVRIQNILGHVGGPSPPRLYRTQRLKIALKYG